VITPSVPPAEAAEYLERFLAIDPFVGLPDGQVIALFEYVGESELKNTAYYRDWFERIDGSHVLGVDIRFKSGLRGAAAHDPRAPAATYSTRRSGHGSSGWCRICARRSKSTSASRPRSASRR